MLIRKREKVEGVKIGVFLRQAQAYKFCGKRRNGDCSAKRWSLTTNTARAIENFFVPKISRVTTNNPVKHFGQEYKSQGCR